MHTKPNSTRLTGRVAAIRPEADGWGAEVDLDVLSNDTPSPDGDFIRPQGGQKLTAFYTRPDDLKVGDVVRAEASLSGGPTGSRAVLRSVQVT